MEKKYQVSLLRKMLRTDCKIHRLEKLCLQVLERVQKYLIIHYLKPIMKVQSEPQTFKIFTNSKRSIIKILFTLLLLLVLLHFRMLVRVKK